MMAPKGLGTGLGALFGEAALEPRDIDCVFLPISKVEPKAGQPRKYFDELALGELSESILEHGVIQPLTVRKLSSGYYQIIAGERRWRAARQAGLSEVPCRIIEADDRGATEIALIENLQREDLNPVEEAEGYRTLIEEYNLTQDEAAGRVGRSRSAVTNALRLLALTREVRDFLEQGVLSAGHARAILQIKGDEDRLSFAQRIIRDGLSVRQAESLAARLGKKPPDKREKAYAVDYVSEAEKRLTKSMGRKVKIVSGRKKGRFEIEYYDGEDMELVIAALESLKLSGGKIEHEENAECLT